MKTSTLTFVFLFVISITSAQISVQTVAYWELNEEYSYSGLYSNYKVKDQDTSYTSKTSYDINVKILDVTDSTYTVEWLYSNHKLIEGTEIVKKLTETNDTIRVIFKTDELGAFVELINLEEILQSYDDKFSRLSDKYSSEKSLVQKINSAKEFFSNPTYVKNNSIKDLVAFYTFHGGKYDLNEEYTGVLQTPNNYNPSSPFDTSTTVWLDEINSENNNYILRSTMVIDENQLKQSVSKKTGIAIDSIPDLKHETFVASRIHGSGWTTYMISTREVKTEKDLSVEEYILQMK